MGTDDDFNGWSGAHFIAERNVVDYAVYSIHLSRSCVGLHSDARSLVPAKNAKEGVKVRTKAAAAADADLLIEENSATEGECPNVKQRTNQPNETERQLLIVLAQLQQQRCGW